MQCVCMCLHRVEVCTHTSTWCGLGLAGNVNSIIGGVVPGDNLWPDFAVGGF